MTSSAVKFDFIYRRR